MAVMSDEESNPTAPLADNPSDSELAHRFSSRAPSLRSHRQVDLTLLVQFGRVGLLTHIRQGKVAQVVDIAGLPPLASFDFSIKAGADAWNRFWQAVPRAGSHDIFALARNGDMTIEGNLHPFMANLQYVKDLLAVGRRERI